MHRTPPPRHVITLSAAAFALLTLLPCACQDRPASPTPPPSATVDGRHDGIAAAALGPYNEGMALLEASRYFEAEARLATALEADPTSAPLLYAQALAQYYQGGDLDVPGDSLERLEAARPQLADIPYLLGHLRLKQQRYDEAIAAFHRAAERASVEHYTIPYSEGTALVAAGRPAEAIGPFREALRLEPHSVAASYALAQTLLDLGRAEEGAAALEAFAGIREAMWAEKFEYRYRGMGPLMMGLTPQLQRPQAASAAPTYRTRRAPPGAAGSEPTRAVAATLGDRAWLERHVVCPVGSGAALLDVEGDGDLDLLELRCDPSGEQPAAQLSLRDAEGRIAPAPSGAFPDLVGLGMGAATGDVDGDGDPDLVVTMAQGLRLLLNQGDGRFLEASEASGVAAQGWCTGATLVDWDHDGDLDLHVARFVDLAAVVDPEAPFPETFAPLADLLFENDGTGRFTDRSARAGVPPARSLGALWADLDGDADIDLVQLDVSGPSRLLLNQRDGSFAEASPPAPLPDRAAAAVTADLDGDGLLDLAFSRWADPPLELRFAAPSGRLLPGPEPTGLPAGPGYGIAVSDPLGTGQPGLLLAADGALWWVIPSQPAPRALRLDLFDSPQAGLRAVLPADLDRDGAEDLVLGSAAGSWQLAGASAPSGGWLRLRLEGQFGSPLDGQGAVVDARVGALWQARQLGGGGGYLGGAPAELSIALGQADAVELLRVHWPSGIRQAITGIETGRELRIREQGLKSSCPQLFARGAEGWSYVSDLIGAAALGIPESPGLGVDADHDELITLAPGLPAPLDGALHLRLVEPLEEVLYLDAVSLLAVDHPTGTELVPRERYQFTPPRDPTGLILLEDPQPLVGAWDDRGNDLSESLRSRDGTAAATWDRAQLGGFAEEHAMILDLGEAPPDSPVLLILDGWVRYATVEEMEAAAAVGVAPLGPALEVQTPAGEWRVVTDSAGFPAGRPKTMTLDLSGAFEGERQRVRLTTNLQLYWDRIRVDRSGGKAPERVHAVPLSEARLWRSGYPLATQSGDAEPLALDGEHFRWPPLGFVVAPGNYTRLGPVTPLLTTADDHLVVMSHGEAVDLAFDSAGLAPPPEGFTRSYAVLTEGWMKDQEPGTLAGDRVGPLPWRGMGRYPPPPGVQRPDDPEYRRYQAEWNTRTLGGGTGSEEAPHGG